MERIQELVREVLRLCSTYPEAVYSRQDMQKVCHYTAGRLLGAEGLEGNRGCVMGQALRNTGIADDAKLATVEGTTISGALDRWFPDQVSGRSCAWLNKVQAAQDSGLMLGQCLEQADALDSTGVKYNFAERGYIFDQEAFDKIFPTA